HTVLFGFLILFAIVEGCISSWLAARYSSVPSRAWSALRQRTYFLVFVSWWTVLGATIYMLLFLHSPNNGSVMTSVASHGIFLSLTWILWLSGAIAITVTLGGGHNCSSTHLKACWLLDFHCFAWACWIITTILLLVVIWRGISRLRRGDGAGGQLVD
ncbi:hypothetical protein BU17DRAFT_46650, partial [Hysterangium stoloniferum]